MTNNADLVKALKLSHVPRWAIIDTMKEQSVADHSFRVAVLSTRIFSLLVSVKPKEMLDMVESHDLLEYALLHDIDEALTGDIPSTYKREDRCDPGFDEDSDLVKAIVKVADNIEAIIFLKRYGIRPDRILWELNQKNMIWGRHVCTLTGIRHCDMLDIIDQVIKTGNEYE